MDHNGSCRRTEDKVAVRQGLCSSHTVLPVETITVVGIADFVGGVGRNKRYSLVGSYPDAPITALHQTPDVIRGKTVVDGYLTTFVLGQMEDIDASAIGGNP